MTRVLSRISELDADGTWHWHWQLQLALTGHVPRLLRNEHSVVSWKQSPRLAVPASVILQSVAERRSPPDWE